MDLNTTHECQCQGHYCPNPVACRFPRKCCISPTYHVCEDCAAECRLITDPNALCPVCGAWEDCFCA
jgi:hypothetical protein